MARVSFFVLSLFICSINLLSKDALSSHRSFTEGMLFGRESVIIRKCFQPFHFYLSV